MPCDLRYNWQTLASRVCKFYFKLLPLPYSVALMSNAGTFSGDKGPDTPDLLQAFLRSLYDIGRTSRLSEACMVCLIQRRTLLMARTLVDNFLAGLGDTTAPGTLLKLVLYLEKNFSLSWRPPQARTTL